MSNQGKEPSRILLPKVDIIFKLLFGDKRNVEILIDFLKSVLSIPDDEYESITIEDTHLKQEETGGKLSIVDVRLATKSGKILHIEMQVLEQKEMPERITYYNAKMLVSQLKSGEIYASLKKTISIVIADFSIINDSNDYFHSFQLTEKSTGILFTDLMEINTLELNKIPPTDDNTKKYDWVRFLKAEKEEEFEMLAEKNPAIKQAVVELKRLSQDESAQLLYEARLKAARDEQSRMDTAVGKARAEAKEEGKEEVAKVMLQDGVQIELIARYTGVDLATIKGFNV